MNHKSTLITRGLGWAGLVILVALGLGLMLWTFNDALIYFYTPTEVMTQLKLKDAQMMQRTLRLGGLVQNGSLASTPQGYAFVLTDTKNQMPVTFSGLLPALFREGQGIVAVGKLRLGANGAPHFIAEQVLAKHDETYMPPEIAASLKDQGLWRGAP